MDLSIFQHSIFLSALGTAILHSFWQSFLLWIVYKLVISFKKNCSSNFKHNLSVLLVCTAFAWFLNTLFSKILLASPASEVITTNSPTISEASSTLIQQILFYSKSLLPYLSVAYIFLLFFLLIKFFAGYRQVSLMSQKNLIIPDQQLQNFSAKVASNLKIAKQVKVWISEKVSSPATIGFFKPVILIPIASINNLSPEQLEAIILHEFSHIKRNDYIVNLVITFIETVLFFNPFIALFIKIIKQERENCCDDFVLEYRYDPHSYASALLHLEQTRMTNLPLAMAAVSGKKELLSRIKRITGNNTVNEFNYKQKLVTLIITTAVFCCLGWISSLKIKKEATVTATKAKEIIKKESTKTVIYNKMNSEEDENREAMVSGKSGSDTNNINLKKTKNSKTSNKTSINKVTGSHEMEFNFGDEIEKGLKQAFIEIEKIDWHGVQNDIQNSFKDMDVTRLPQDQKNALETAKQYVSGLDFQKQQLQTDKILEQLQKNKLIRDSTTVRILKLLYSKSPSGQAWTMSINDNSTHRLLEKKSGSGRQNPPIYFNDNNPSGNPRIRIISPDVRSSYQSAPIPQRHPQSVQKTITQRIIIEI